MHVDVLPDELLLLIFKYVDVQDLMSVVPRVARRWAGLARLLAAAARSEPELRALRRGLRALLVPAGLAPAPLLAGAAHLAPRLTSLAVHAGVRFSSAELGALALRLPQLAHLDVFPAPGASVTPAPRGLRSLVVNAPRDSFARLEHSQLRALHMFGDAQYCSTRRLSWLTARREHLTELTLRCAELGDAAYAAVGSCSNLVVLQLYSCWLMRAGGAAEAARPRRLRRLHVTGAVMVRSAALSQMLDRLPRGLEELALSGGALGDEHVNALAMLPRLEVLEAWRCRLTGCGVLQLADACRLRVLDLDMPLDVDQLVTLRRNRTLGFVRCQPPEMCSADEMRTIFGEGTLRLEPVVAQFPGYYFRPNGDGFRDKLYYHWTPPLQLRPRRDPAGGPACPEPLAKKRRSEKICYKSS